MSGLAVLILSAAVWIIYCGASSFKPVATARALIGSPSSAAAIIDGAKAAVTDTPSVRVSSGGSFDPTPTATPTGTGVSMYQAYAMSQMSAHLWSSNQMQYLIKLWDRESSWNPTATNPSSGAYGIPQALPASKMATAGADYKTNYKTQIRWGLSYIASRYSTPEAAWNHEVSQGWY
jgi:hypothetical protein